MRVEALTSRAPIYVAALIVWVPFVSSLAAAADNTTATTSAPAIRATCIEPSGSSCPKDNSAMEHEETYKGTTIHIRTIRAPDGAWQASAEVANQTSVAPLAAPGTYASEQEARSAALSTAAAHVDRSRAGVGKP
jgi:hypothetical protein